MDIVNEMASLAQQIENAVNANEDEFILAMTKQFLFTHRTLQQNFVRAITAVLVQLADQSTDLRNEDAVKFCKKVKEMSDNGDAGFRYV